MARVIVKVLVDTAVASIISSIAVSGSTTIVKVVPAGIDCPPIREAPDWTTNVVAPAVTALVSVVCCEREE
jgi:hypothetical protein